MTKEQEKALLITLSQVLNKVKLCTAGFDSDSGSGSGSDSDDGDHGKLLMDVSQCHSSASHCILLITNELVFLLVVESHYAQHLAANVIVSISEFVVASGSYWLEFMQSLCFYFEIMICKVFSPSSDPPIRATHRGCDSVDLVLRAILKQLKHEDEVKVWKIYFQVLDSCLQVIPWDSCNRVTEDWISQYSQNLNTI